MTHALNKPILLSLTFLLVSLNQSAQAQPVAVKTYGQHVGGNIVYQQQVTNNGSRDVMTIGIAENTDYQGSTLPYSIDFGELDALPVGSTMFKRAVNPDSISGPSGWTGTVIQINDGGRFFQWRRPPYPQAPLLSSQTLRFSITVPKFDEAYLTGHFSAGFGDGNNPWAYNGVMEKLDTTPPTLSFTLTPSTIWPPNNKLVAINATIAVQDDYDPAPEIKLESITANEPLADGDIQDAGFGTDDRDFYLAAKRAGNNQSGRIYNVTYSATDASGNKATASATVTVPHDQGK